MSSQWEPRPGGAAPGTNGVDLGHKAHEACTKFTKEILGSCSLVYMLQKNRENKEHKRRPRRGGAVANTSGVKLGHKADRGTFSL